MSRAADHASAATPLWAVNLLTFLASIGTGVMWNGVSFIAKHDYGFEKGQTLCLYFVLGVMYVIGAASTGAVLRRVERWISPRAVLALIFALETIASIGLAAGEKSWTLWLVACSISVLSSWQWPIVESYLTAGRHGRGMRDAIGWWNLWWTTAVAVTLILIAPLMREPPFVVHVMGQDLRLAPRLAIVCLGALNAAALVMLIWFGSRPGEHGHEESQAAVNAEYPMLLKAARLLLPLSYVMNSAMSPLLPYLFAKLALPAEWETPVTSTWMWVRVIAMAIMWRLGFWHGRWGTLLMGGVMMTLGFGVIVMAFNIPLMILGLAAFGTGMGVIYYAALYYAMSVGRAEVDAGGTHEALIGVGYAVGPLTGLASLPLADGEQRFNAAVIGLVWLIILGGGAGAAKCWWSARASRRLRGTRPSD